MPTMPAPTQKPIIPWKRFWCRFGDAIHIGDEHQGQGFLTDPDRDFTRFYNPHLFTFEDLVREKCLILCGDPGTGKSTALQQARPILENALGADAKLIWLEFRDVPNESVFARRTFQSDAWKQWQNSSGKLALVVDGVDEGLVKIPGFVSYLASELRNAPIERLQIVLVCRSAEWPVSEGQQLIGLWGVIEKPPIFELCPLRQCDAMQAAEALGIDAFAFNQAVYEQKIIGLAALPTTLFFLLAEFRDNGVFTGTHRELYERGCQRLARENDPHRIEALRALRRTTRVSTPEEIYEAASRLAALFLLCGKSAIHIGPVADAEAESDLHLSEAADSIGIGDGSLTEDVLYDAIASGLFTSRGPNRLGFAHQTFAECLAARFISRLPLIQIRKLLCARDAGDEHVIPQLAETAAWVAGMMDDFFDYLCRIEPEALLRSDISKVQSHRKKDLIAAILEKAKRADLFDERNLSRFYSSLKHPELANQLRSYLTDKTLNVVVRRIAFSIAGECKVAELCDDLLRMIQDATETQHFRNQAAQTLEHLIPTGRLADLIPLATGQIKPDPDDTIRGSAIRRLVPEVWSVSQAAPYLHAPRNDHFFGTYHFLLKYHLPRHLKVEDVIPVLEQLVAKTHCFDTVILTRTMERRHQLGLDSYDRFFPSQDTMPKGGFGNAERSFFNTGGIITSEYWNSGFLIHDDIWGSNYIAPRDYLKPDFYRNPGNTIEPNSFFLRRSEVVGYTLTTHPKDVPWNPVFAEEVASNLMAKDLVNAIKFLGERSWTKSKRPVLSDRAYQWNERLIEALPKRSLVLRAILITPDDYFDHLGKIRDWSKRRGITSGMEQRASCPPLALLDLLSRTGDSS